MNADEFLRWSEGREGTWELVDGVARLKRTTAMARTTVGHDRIRGNIEYALRSRLRGSPCEVFSESVASRVADNKVRCPDITVDCGAPEPSALETEAPTVLFEILSPSTRDIDIHIKPPEYRALPTLQHFVLIEQRVALCTHWFRNADGVWDSRPIIGLGSVIDLSAIGVSLPLAEVYEGVELRAQD